MPKKFRYKTILIKGPQKGIYAEFPFDSAKKFGTRRLIRVKVEFNENLYFMSLLSTEKADIGYT
ncbi:MAG: DUF1905 domain-containing protein [Draconibacterium sp.]|nr:DUF1905 domain-containing protein [Draconibacterium sp.]